MSIIGSVIIFTYYTISISYMLLLYANYKLCPELLWCGFQFVMFFGVASIVDTSNTDDVLLAFLYLIALLCFIAMSYITQQICPPQKYLKIETNLNNYKKRKQFLWIIMLSSIVLCGWFFIQAGGNTFIQGVLSMISNTDFSYKNSRLGFLKLSGVGYIYQLRVTVLPISVLYFVIMNRRKIITIPLVLLMVAFLVGTGQRGGLFSFAIITFVCVYYLFSKKVNNERKTNKMFVYLGVLLVAGALFGLSTVLNGRVAEGGTVFDAILKRLFVDNQGCAVYGFRYIREQPIQYGKDWFMQILDILPGKNSYVSLDSRIFAYTHGGNAGGTAPACIWGTAYYNFGVPGVVLLSSLLGIVLTKLHQKYTCKVIDSFQTVIYSAEQSLLAFWVAGGLVVLFNNGLVAVLILSFVINMGLKFRFVIKGINK